MPRRNTRVRSALVAAVSLLLSVLGVVHGVARVSAALPVVATAITPSAQVVRFGTAATITVTYVGGVADDPVGVSWGDGSATLATATNRSVQLIHDYGRINATFVLRAVIFDQECTLATCGASAVVAIVCQTDCAASSTRTAQTSRRASDWATAGPGG